ncbi:BsuPI-related putative proteinase inhibitor [Bacillus sp. PS06]|uniref:BsuPI-related putative proteinase inhibitor n=1 Tax=Bacillus sp. PS06 TaxID=2764176 RepID=UPI001785748F|nr:BsuPI-related putative proteinase inhibitor [Bacillus sp. PS06]MBD8067571.1 hypothetical protein [Bacillus sp. PS06]
MRKLILPIIVSLITLAGCGTGGTTTGEPKAVEEVPVTGSPIAEKPTKEIPPIEVPLDEEVTGDVEALLNELELTIDSKATAGEAVLTFAVKNTSNQDVTLTFTSGQKYEIYVKNEGGMEVYRYSIDKSFLMALQDVEIKAGEEVSWQEIWDYKQTGERIAAGEYTATVEIVAAKINGIQAPISNTLKATTKITVPEENVAFRNIEVMGSGGEYTVTGEARVFEASFFYAVEDGHDYIIPETVITTKAGAPSWAPFEINLSIPSEKLPSNGTLTLELFERSAKDGEIVNMYFATLEQFS